MSIESDEAEKSYQEAISVFPEELRAQLGAAKYESEGFETHRLSRGRSLDAESGHVGGEAYKEGSYYVAVSLYGKEWVEEDPDGPSSGAGWSLEWELEVLGPGNKASFKKSGTVNFQNGPYPPDLSDLSEAEDYQADVQEFLQHIGQSGASALATRVAFRYLRGQ